MSLAESLEQAAEALPGDADSIRPANGDPSQLLELLDAAAAGRVASWLLANYPDDGAELASCWLESPAGVATLSRVAASALPKPGRKALRRVLHQARSRGIELDEETSEPEPRVARLPSLEQAFESGYVSPYDPRGGRLVYLAASNPSGGVRVFELLLDEERGVVDFQVYSAGRSQVKRFIRDITRRERFAAIEVDALAVRALIARRAADHPGTRPFPSGFGEWRERLREGASQVATPGEEVREQLGDEACSEAVEALAAEVVAGRLGPWPPPPGRLQEVVAGLRQQIESERGAAQAMNEEKLEQTVRQTVDSLYSAVSGTGKASAERLEETAYLMWRDGQEETARACLASASAFRRDDIAGSPVARAMTEALVTALLDDLREQSGDAAEAERG